MKLPKLRPPAAVKNGGTGEVTLAEFGGLDTRPGQNNCVKSISGFTEEFYPVYRTEPLSFRRTLSVSDPSSFRMERLLGAWAVAKDGNFYYPEGTLRGALTQPARQFAVMNDIIYIFPSGQYYDTVSGSFGRMQRERVTAAGAVSFEDGTLYGEEAEANTLRCDSADLSLFRAGDAVTVSGCTLLTDNNKTAIIREVDSGGHKLRFSENCFTVGTESGAVTLRVSVPELEGVCVCENRLWGYIGRTIYASKLGDPLNWSVYDGISTDSYTVSVDGEGALTACTAFLGYPVFFREQQIYKVYGTQPSNFSLTAGAHSGVRAGAARSVCAVEDTLYYLSGVGMVAYSGGIPSALPEFGTELAGCICRTDGKRLYVLSGGRLFRYAPRLRLWTELRPAANAAAEPQLTDVLCGPGYPICVGVLQSGGVSQLCLNTSSRGAAAEGGNWQTDGNTAELTLGDFFTSGAGKNRLQELTLRLRAEPSQGAAAGSVTAAFLPDGGTAIPMNTRTVSADSGREYIFTIIPRRCSSFRISVSAQQGSAAGYISLLSLTFRYSGGSGLPGE